MNNLFSDILLPITIALITLGVGLSIKASDFRHVFRYPRSLTIGLLSQMILLPGIAFLIAFFSNIDPVYKVGLIVISVCPGGATSNLVTYILNGNVALSISLVVINSVITLATIPIAVSLAIFYFTSEEAKIVLPIGHTILNIFLLTMVPAVAGINIRHYFPEIARKLQKPLRYILPLILLIVYTGVVFIDRGSDPIDLRDSIKLLPYPFLLNFLSMFLGWMVARKFNLNSKNQFTISIEVGLQNSALAIFIAATLLESQAMALVPIIYGSFSFFSTLFFGYIIRRFSSDIN